MIPRYEEKDLSRLWSEDYKFETFLKVELAILAAQEKTGKIPSGTTKEIQAKVKINAARVKEIEATTQHDIIAFCTSITEQLSPEVGRYFHFGVTSSDIIDTSLSLQVKDSLNLVLPELKKICELLKNKANETKLIITMGRSHGMFAEPMSFGQKFLSSYAEFYRRYQDYQEFYDQELTGQFSGAVGNYTIVTPQLEELALQHLGLKTEPVSTQIIPRDRLAKLVNAGALLGSAIERFSVEIRHLHRSDVGEVQEGFAPGQKGSSIMPHKKNPIAAENLSGIARVLRSHALIAQENITLWHERDISHSSAERLYLPDHLGLILYSLRRLGKLLSNLQINQENIEIKVKNNFDYLSSFYLHFLIEHTSQTREELYAIVQKAAFAAQSAEEFVEKMLKDCEAKRIKIPTPPRPSWENLKNLYLKNTEKVFERVFKTYS